MQANTTKDLKLPCHALNGAPVQHVLAEHTLGLIALAAEIVIGH